MNMKPSIQYVRKIVFDVIKTCMIICRNRKSVLRRTHNQAVIFAGLFLMHVETMKRFRKLEEGWNIQLVKQSGGKNF